MRLNRIEGDSFIIAAGNISIIGGKKPAAKWDDTVGLEREVEFGERGKCLER